MIKKWYQKLSQKKRKGFDGIIVAIALILLVMILVFLFKEKIGSQVSKSIDAVAQEIESISDWESGLN